MKLVDHRVLPRDRDHAELRGLVHMTPGLPADHRVIVGLYESAAGRRAVTSMGVDQAVLERCS